MTNDEWRQATPEEAYEGVVHTPGRTEPDSPAPADALTSTLLGHTPGYDLQSDPPWLCADCNRRFASWREFVAHVVAAYREQS